MSEKYIRRGILQGRADVKLLPTARIRNTVVVNIPAPPDHPDFYYADLAGSLPATLSILKGHDEIDVVLNSAKVTDIIAAIQDHPDLAGYRVEFSNQFLTIVCPTDSEGIAILPAPDAVTDAAPLLGFSIYPNTSGAVFRGELEGSPARAGISGPSKQTFLMRYEDRLTDSVNRALASIAANAEDLYIHLSDEVAVPKFIQHDPTGAPTSTAYVMDGDDIVGLRLNFPAYTSGVATTVADIENMFRITDRFGARSLNHVDTEEPVRVIAVTTGAPVGNTPTFNGLYSAPVAGGGFITASIALGDGGNILGRHPFMFTDEAGSTFNIVGIVDGVAIKCAGNPDFTADNMPAGTLVFIDGSTTVPRSNDGKYIVEEVWDANTLKIKPVITDNANYHVLLTTIGEGGSLGTALVTCGDFAPGPLYALFDRPLSLVDSKPPDGIGLLYGTRSSLYDFVVSSLLVTGLKAGETVDDTVVRALRAIRGPNSRHYRLTEVADSYAEHIDKGDKVNLESLSTRPLLGRDMIDLWGNDLSEIDEEDLYEDAYTTIAQGGEKGQMAILGAPINLYNISTNTRLDLSAKASGVFTAVNTSSNPWSGRLAGPGPFAAILHESNVLEITDSNVFYLTDVGFKIRIAGATDKTRNKTYILSRWLDNKRAVLSSIDDPGKVYSTPETVTFTVGMRASYNAWGGALLRLDKGTQTGADPTTDNSQLGVISIQGQEGITGHLVVNRVHLSLNDDIYLNFFDKEEVTFEALSVGDADERFIIVKNANVNTRSQLLYSIFGTHGFLQSEITHGVYNTISAQLDHPGKASFADPIWVLDFPGMCFGGTTFVELSGTSARDGIYLLKQAACKTDGTLALRVVDLAGNAVSMSPTNLIHSGYVRLFNAALSQNTKVPSQNPARTLDSVGHYIHGHGNAPYVENKLHAALKVLATGGSISAIDVATGPIYAPPKALLDDDNIMLNESYAGNSDYPDHGIRVFTGSPSKSGIFSYNISWWDPDALPMDHYDQGKGSFGALFVASTESRAMAKAQASNGAVPITDNDDEFVTASHVLPRAAAVGIRQIFSQRAGDQADPTLRDPALIISLEAVPIADVKDHVNLALKAKRDSNAGILLSLSDDVYQTNQDRIHWSVRLAQVVDDAYSVGRLRLFNKTMGPSTVKLEITDGNVHLPNEASVSYNSSTKIIHIQTFNGHPTAKEVYDAIYDSDSAYYSLAFSGTFNAELSGNDGTWPIKVMSFEGYLEDHVNEFTTTGFRWLLPHVLHNPSDRFNLGIEVQDGDIQIENGVLNLKAQSRRKLTGVASNLIPVDHPFDDVEVNSTGTIEGIENTTVGPLSLGEPALLIHGSDFGITLTVTAGLNWVTVVGTPVLAESDIGRVIDFYLVYTNDSDIITHKYFIRTITGFNSDLTKIYLNTPITWLDLNPNDRGDAAITSANLDWYVRGRPWNARLHDVEISGQLRLVAPAPGESPAAVVLPSLRNLEQVERTVFFAPGIDGHVLSREALIDRATLIQDKLGPRVVVVDPFEGDDSPFVGIPNPEAWIGNMWGWIVNPRLYVQPVDSATEALPNDSRFNPPNQEHNLWIRYGSSWITPIRDIQQINNPNIASYLMDGTASRTPHRLAAYGGVRAMIWDLLGPTNYFSADPDVVNTYGDTVQRVRNRALESPSVVNATYSQFGNLRSQTMLDATDSEIAKWAESKDKAYRNIWSVMLKGRIPVGAKITKVKFYGLVEWSFAVVKQGKLYYLPFNASLLLGDVGDEDGHLEIGAQDPLKTPDISPTQAIKFRVYHSRLVPSIIRDGDADFNMPVLTNTTVNSSLNISWVIKNSSITGTEDDSTLEHTYTDTGEVVKDPPFLRAWKAEAADLSWIVKDNDLLDIALDSVLHNLSGGSFYGYVGYTEQRVEGESDEDLDTKGVFYEYMGPTTGTSDASARNKLFLWLNGVEVTYTYDGISFTTENIDQDGHNLITF